ncbi:hypothetical protein B0H19DRAFT_74553 [Mycena capillaripes]|nr:hypothetical protein B0H19DRAFT_74553 [Mycena capillaripes]
MSTGKLCVDVGNGEWPSLFSASWQVRTEPPSLKLTESDLGDKLLSRLKLEQFYAILIDLNSDSLRLSSAPGTITLPSLCRIPNLGADFNATEISAFPIANHFTLSSIDVKSWYSYAFQVETLPTGWTRVEYLDNPGGYSRLWMSITLLDEDDARKWWFSQQGFVLAQLQDVISVDDVMFFVTDIDFCCTLNTPLDNFALRGTFMADAPIDDVYLFIFSPKVDLVDGRFIVTSPPAAEKYYWAFDPAGLDRLSCRTAEDLGLPAPQLSIRLYGARWNETYHNLIRDFHAAKGFDPCSQDMAVAIGYPLVDIEDINKFSRSLIGGRVRNCPDDEIEDAIYYSFGLC